MSGEPGLALIAGSGALPRLIAEDRARRGAHYLICGFEGIAPDWIEDHPHHVGPFEKPGALFKAMRRAGVEVVAFAGGMSRPRLSPLRFDVKAVALAAKVLPLFRKGDDAMLRGLAEVFEGEGFRLVGPHELLEGLLAPQGALSTAEPAAEDFEDLARAADVVDALGAIDVGQAAVVARGVCLGVETIQGTDALLDFAGATPEALRPGGGRAAGVLYKGPKPGQDWRVDLPAIGPETLRRAAKAGLAGVAVKAGGVLVLGLDETRAAADRHGLFLHGRA